MIMKQILGNKFLQHTRFQILCRIFFLLITILIFPSPINATSDLGIFKDSKHFLSAAQLSLRNRASAEERILSNSLNFNSE